MKLLELKPRFVKYTNASSVKFNNRRASVFKLEDGFGIEFRICDETSPRCIQKRIKGKIDATYLTLTSEASEALLILLAEELGYVISNK